MTPQQIEAELAAAIQVAYRQHSVKMAVAGRRADAELQADIAAAHTTAAKTYAATPVGTDQEPAQVTGPTSPRPAAPVLRPTQRGVPSPTPPPPSLLSDAATASNPGWKDEELAALIAQSRE